MLRKQQQYELPTICLPPLGHRHPSIHFLPQTLLCQQTVPAGTSTLGTVMYYAAIARLSRVYGFAAFTRLMVLSNTSTLVHFVSKVSSQSQLSCSRVQLNCKQIYLWCWQTSETCSEHCARQVQVLWILILKCFYTDVVCCVVTAEVAQISQAV